MAQEPSTFRFTLALLLSLAGCFGVQALAFYGFNLATGKTESNYYSTLSRFQGAIAPGAEIALSGSSISGRLPGREFGNPDVANLGSDGGSPLDGLTLLSEGVVGRPKWLVVEINTAFNSLGFADTPAVEGSRGPGFKIGGKVPLLGASSRPTGMLYGYLLGRRWKGAVEPFALKEVPSPLPPPPLDESQLSVLQKERIQLLTEGILKARREGVRVLLARYPAGPMKQRQIDEIQTVAARIHEATGVPFLDLESQIPRAQLTFTDSVHLGPESATRILATLRNACQQLSPTIPESISQP